MKFSSPEAEIFSSSEGIECGFSAMMGDLVIRSDPGVGFKKNRAAELDKMVGNRPTNIFIYCTGYLTSGDVRPPGKLNQGQVNLITGDVGAKKLLSAITSVAIITTTGS